MTRSGNVLLINDRIQGRPTWRVDAPRAVQRGRNRRELNEIRNWSIKNRATLRGPVERNHHFPFSLVALAVSVDPAAEKESAVNCFPSVISHIANTVLVDRREMLRLVYISAFVRIAVARTAVAAPMYGKASSATTVEHRLIGRFVFLGKMGTAVEKGKERRKTKYWYSCTSAAPRRLSGARIDRVQDRYTLYNGPSPPPSQKARALSLRASFFVPQDPGPTRIPRWARKEVPRQKKPEATGKSDILKTRGRGSCPIGSPIQH